MKSEKKARKAPLMMRSMSMDFPLRMVDRRRGPARQ
jgi:hypothetical protein